MYALVRDKGAIKERLEPIVEEYEGQFLAAEIERGGFLGDNYDPRKTNYQCFEDAWDEMLWGYLQGYLKGAEAWATKTYKDLKLGHEEVKHEDLWL